MLDNIKDILQLRTAKHDFIKVKAHVGILGNEEADKVAEEATRLVRFSRLPLSTKLYTFNDSQLMDIPFAFMLS